MFLHLTDPYVILCDSVHSNAEKINQLTKHIRKV